MFLSLNLESIKIKTVILHLKNTVFNKGKVCSFLKLFVIYIATVYVDYILI